MKKLALAFSVVTIAVSSISVFADSIVFTSQMAGNYLPKKNKTEMIESMQATCAKDGLSLDIFLDQGLYRSETSYLYEIRGRCYSAPQVNGEGSEIKLDVKDGQWREATDASDDTHQQGELKQIQLMTALCTKQDLRLDLTNEVTVDYAGENISIYTLIGRCTSSNLDKH
jgi:hypothetical protein